MSLNSLQPLVHSFLNVFIRKFKPLVKRYFVMNDLVSRIDTSLKEKKMSWSAAAVAIGLSPQAPTKWKKGQIGKDTLEDLANLLEKDVGWLLTGEESRRNAEITNKQVSLWSDGDDVPLGYVAIDFYNEVSVSAGCGYMNQEQQSPLKLWFREDTLKDCNVNPLAAKVITVRGESMFPELVDGQAISVDTSATRIYDGEIYAFLVGDDMKVKFLFNWSEQGIGGFKAVSRNDDKVRYPDEYYSPERIKNENIQVYGQYWWKSETRKIRR